MTRIELPIDQDLLPGARNAVRVCLNIQPDERVTLITDEACADIAGALVQEIDAVGAPLPSASCSRTWRRGRSPGLPAVVAADMERSAGQHLRRPRAGERARRRACSSPTSSIAAACGTRTW